MRFRRARTLVITFYPGQIGVHNFLTKTRIACSSEAVEFLSKLDDWHTEDQILDYFPNIERPGLAAQIAELTTSHAIVVEGTQHAEMDQRFRDSWPWGMIGGYYHFATRNTPLLGEPAQLNMVEQRLEAGQTPPRLYDSNHIHESVIRLPAVPRDSSLLSLMRQRRSERKYLETSISLSMLAQCLYAGNGIVGFRDDPVYGRVPISTTPSLGGSNPYELYVHVSEVEELERGFYHYAAWEHDLARLDAGPKDVNDLFGEQSWASQASALIFLVAYFGRTGWKHHLAMAYRSVLIEAGCIVQNIALMATTHGLSAVPISSLKHSVIESYLGIPDVEGSVILGVALGRPAVNEVTSRVEEGER